MMWERDRAETARRMESALRIAIPVLVTVAGIVCAWRLNGARHARSRERIRLNALSGPMESLPHSDPGDEAVETASEDSFPASDPPAYTAQDRLGHPAR